MTQTPVWKFKPLAKDDKLVDPIEQEFFTTESVGEPTDALVRETIQNSLDAKIPGYPAPVRVRFFVSGERGAVRPQDCSPFFKGLEAHLTAKDNGLSSLPNLSQQMPFVAIEDFGTKGLLGDPSDSEANPRVAQNFFYFWRNIGRSQKSEGDRGRWGLGKTVFPASSLMNTFFGLTIRQGEKDGLLMGQAVLKNHKDSEGNSYRPYGDFGLFEDIPGAEYFALPVNDQRAIAAFRNLFRLRRLDEPGLSIVIPAPNQELHFDNILVSLLKQYFYPILQRELVVEIESSNRSLTITHETIRPILNDTQFADQDKRSLLGLYELTAWGLERRPEEYFTLGWPDLKGAPSWNRLLDELDPSSFRERFEAERRIAFRIGVPVKQEGKDIVPSHFNVYLERDQSMKRGQSHFVRQGLQISGVHSALEGNIRGLLVVSHGALGTLLGDAENPAHTEWQRYSPKFKGKYTHGPYTLSFVKNSLRDLALFLTRLKSDIDKDLLKDFFFLEKPLESPGDISILKSDDDSDPETTLPPKVPSGRGPELLRIAKLHGGARVSLDPAYREPIPTLVRLLFAYRVRRGNSFKRYQPPDFNLAGGTITVQHSGIHLIDQRDNLLEFSPTDREFELNVSGFDPSRDLVVRAHYEMESE